MASYRLYDRFGAQVYHRDLQAKGEWCRDGERLEDKFLELYGEKFGLRLNEEKKHNPFVPDFIYSSPDGCDRYVDLKSQRTPFFSSRRYGVDPQFAVTLNKVDVDRYRDLYPGIIVLYHINWVAVKMEFGSGGLVEVDPMEGLWAASINNLLRVCSPRNLHFYLQRVGDRGGNARDSYVLDIRERCFKRLDAGELHLGRLV